MAKPKKPKTRDDYLADYGYAAALIDAYPELKRLFDRATDVKKGVWTPQRFAAAVKNSVWYKKHSDTWRAAETLRLSDPATYNKKFQANQTWVLNEARNMGATINGRQAAIFARSMLFSGATEDVIRDALAKKVDFGKAAESGQAAEIDDALAATAYNNGLRLDVNTRNKNAQAILRGDMTMEGVQQQLRDTAASTYPAWAAQIKAGQDVMSLASPYKQSMAAILEIPDSEIDLFDPTMRSALTAKGADGAPAQPSIWQFEQSLRKDPRWAKTKNARTQVAGVVGSLMSKWGFNG